VADIPEKTHFGHSFCGASSGMGDPHFGQLDSGVLFMSKVPEPLPGQGYKKTMKSPPLAVDFKIPANVSQQWSPLTTA
jgi:hypothetical protein